MAANQSVIKTDIRGSTASNSVHQATVGFGGAVRWVRKQQICWVVRSGWIVWAADHRGIDRDRKDQSTGAQSWQPDKQNSTHLHINFPNHAMAHQLWLCFPDDSRLRKDIRAAEAQRRKFGQTTMVVDENLASSPLEPAKDQ